jgi:D-aminoacyl-tRNA deacylase
MKVIIVSKTDTASVNIGNHLHELRTWKEKETFHGNPLFHHNDLYMATINDEHIFHDNVDSELAGILQEKPECIIYASRHRSESGRKSLTVHPVGNFGNADFGGISKTLVPSSPHLMTEAVRILKERARGLDYSVSFEATHHGPHLKTPAFFIEIGSQESEWMDEDAGQAIAETIVDIRATEYPIAIGMGGGHYVPRITDVALNRKVSFGHMVPTYALSYFTEDMATQALELSGNAKIVYFHKKHLRGGQYAKWKNILSDMGCEVIRTADLEAL